MKTVVRIEEIKVEKEWSRQEGSSGEIAQEEFIQVMLVGEGIRIWWHWPEGLEEPELREEYEIHIGGGVKDNVLIYGFGGDME